jgi:8-amino-7-oxononanoate synthase
MPDMSGDKINLAEMTTEQKRELAQRLLSQRPVLKPSNSNPPAEKVVEREVKLIPFDRMPAYLQLKQQFSYLKAYGITNPYFREQQRINENRTLIEGRECINYSTSNYLGLAGHPQVIAAAKQAIDTYGTSVSASRMASGEIPLHRELEREIAEMLGAEGCLVFPNGYGTNVTAIGHLFGQRDLIVHDALVHRSMFTGCLLAGSKRRSFPHNNLDALDQVLSEQRRFHEQAVILVEGAYSMDGDVADLPRLIEIKKRHSAMLMVDEAHSIGVLGKNGHGITEHFNVNPSEVDILMGNLSKAFASMGGYIAGSAALVEYLRYTSPGFIFTVGLSPADSGAALAAIRVMKSESWRVTRLREASAMFLELARQHGLDTGTSALSPVVPVLTGDSATAVLIGENLFKDGINVQPIIYPAVENSAARLRFFITALHTDDEIRQTIKAMAGHLEKLRVRPNEATGV